MTDYIQILKDHNHWRRCNDEKCKCTMSNPTELGIAIEMLIKDCQKGKEAMKILRIISNKPRKTKEQRLANSCITFLDTM